MGPPPANAQPRLTRIVRYLDGSDLMRLLEYLGRFTVVVAVVFYFAECGDRQRAKHYQAWQVTSQAEWRESEAGRCTALHDLVVDGVSLEGVNLAGAPLRDVDLSGCLLSTHLCRGAKMPRADLRWAILSKAYLPAADLEAARFEGAYVLDHSDLRGANLRKAHFEGANLSSVDFSGAHLEAATFGWANISGANFSGAYVRPEQLDAACFYGPGALGLGAYTHHNPEWCPQLTP